MIPSFLCYVPVELLGLMTPRF